MPESIGSAGVTVLDLELATHCFWHFLGSIILFWMVLRFIRFCYRTTFRMITVALRGWPPPHLDADGDSVELSKNMADHVLRRR